MEVNSFWDGERLTNLEILCLSSFIRNGIGYNLYVYDAPEGVPEKVVLKDATDILPRKKIFRYKAGDFNAGSISGFSNLFRYKLIHEIGGWWSDTDVCCLEYISQDFDDVYFQQPAKKGAFSVGSAFFKAPAGSPVMRYCLDLFSKKDVTQIVHGEMGPRLLTEAVLACHKQNCVLAHELFCPVAWWEYERLFVDETLLLDGCFTAHFFNAMITSSGLDKNGVFPAGVPFERLKKKFL